jgi:hypothetical protein
MNVLIFGEAVQQHNSMACSLTLLDPVIFQGMHVSSCAILLSNAEVQKLPI